MGDYETTLTDGTSTGSMVERNKYRFLTETRNSYEEI